MFSYTNLIIATILIYLIGMVLIGFYYSKKNKNVDDFYLGGRKLGPIVTAMSAEASDMSSYLLMGLPGLAVAFGLAEVGWTALGLAVGTYINWLIVAKRIRIYSQRIGAITVPDFFSKRFHDKSNILTLIAAIVIIVFFIPYTASGFSACGKLFESLFGIDYKVTMIISAAIIVVYTTLGGFTAASVTDLIQSIIMTVALVILVIFGIKTAGGWSNVVENAKSIPAYLNLTSTSDGAGGTSPYGALTIASTLAWGLGYFGMPHILLRFMAVENKNKLKTSRRIASIWVVIAMGVAILIGVIGRAIIDGGTLSAENLVGDRERIIIRLSGILSQAGPLFAVTAGIILAGILAATMSTADSQLLAASSSVSQNILRDVLKINISEKKAVIIARLSVIAISIIAVFLALDPDSSVFKIVSFAWAGFGAAFGPIMLFSLFWKRTTKWGALAGMISGGAMVFIWKFLIAKIGGIFEIYELLPAFVISAIFIVVVSLLTKAPEEEIVNEFNDVKAELKN